MSILLVASSNSKDSINHTLIENLKRRHSYEVLYLDSFNNIPMFSKELNINSWVPDDIKSIYQSFQKHLSLVFFAPEHNGYISAFLKNIIDWLSRINRKFLSGKHVTLVSASITHSDHRIMEPSIAGTFSMFDPASFSFVNFNRFGEDLMFDEKRIEDLHSKFVNC